VVIAQSIHADFERARHKASWRSVLMRLVRRRNHLLRFDEVRRHLQAQGHRSLGIYQVPLDAIVGSVGRYHDFDAAFLPRQSQTKGRWLSIDRAHYDDVHLPPVELYKLGQTYFVKDGNHRVSVARERGQMFIDAVVVDVQSPVPIASLAQLEKWLEQQDAVEFFATTGLLSLRPEADLHLTLCGQYEKLLEHISVHRWFLGLERDSPISYEDAVTHWYDHVYTPVVDAIRDADLPSAFPRRTHADLYVWISEHLWYLREAGDFQDATPLNAVALTFAACSMPRRRSRLSRLLRVLGMATVRPVAAFRSSRQGARE
jgi:hypothetical protein